MTRRRRSRRALGAVTTAALVVATLGACTDATGPSAAPTPTRVPEPTATVTRYSLDVTVWYAGVVVSFRSAEARLDARGGSVTVDAVITNPGAEVLGIEGPIRLLVAGETFEPTRETDVPDVDPGATTPVSLEFDVIGHRAAADAVVVIGREGEHQARIPLGPAGGEVAAFEPVGFELSGNATAGSLRLRLRTAELRWDLPDWGEQLASDLASLTVTYDATYTGSFAGGFPFTRDNVALRLPDGTLVRPRADGRSQSIELIGAGKTKKGLRSRFEIPAGVAGDFAIVVIDGRNRRNLGFTLPG